MRIIVTCGPSYEPIDGVRRITNFSTGELGLRLTQRLRVAGHEVICFRGEGATWHDSAVASLAFSTNDDLLSKLTAEAHASRVDAVFHAAALADFRVERLGTERKIASRGGELMLKLVPATKLLPKLRNLFPTAKIVGWKYELDGTREDALTKGRAQISTCVTDRCVVNGAAYGPGFGFLAKDGDLIHFADKAALSDGLAGWL
jgi:phosphopantothenoylcysteine synthetase/decarboxylase